MPAWRLRSPSQIHFKEWEDEFVVYNGLSGATHLLGPATAAVLLTFLESGAPLTTSELCTQLEIAESIESSDSPSDLIAPLVAELERIELIEAAQI